MRSIVRLAAVLSIAILPFAAGSAEAQARTFKIDASGGSQIQFVSEAKLETFTGKTTKASGEIKVDPAAIASAKGDIKVDVASIDTNVELRNEHLAGENWLDAKKFPNAEFVITGISGADKLKPNDVVEVTVKGKFSIHGVTKELSAKAKVRFTPAAEGKPDSLRIQAAFVIMLEDHKVSIPAIVALKVSPEIKVNVDLRATAQ